MSPSSPTTTTTNKKSPGGGLFAGLTMSRSTDDDGDRTDNTNVVDDDDPLKTPVITNRVVAVPTTTTLTLDDSNAEERAGGEGTATTTTAAADVETTALQQLQAPDLTTTTTTTDEQDDHRVLLGSLPPVQKPSENKEEADVTPETLPNLSTIKHDEMNPEENPDSKQPVETEEAVRKKREMQPEEQEQLDKAFEASKHSMTTIPPPPQPPSEEIEFSETGTSAAAAAIGTQQPRRLQVAPDTPIPHPNTCLKLLRKFAYKTRPHISTIYGGAKPRSFLSYVTSPDKKDEAILKPYAELLNVIFEEQENRNPPAEDMEADDDDSTHHHQRHPASSVTTQTTSSETTTFSESTSPSRRSGILISAVTDPSVKQRAAQAVGMFVDVFAIWAHASSALDAQHDQKRQAFLAELQVPILDAATNLVAYGCLDHVDILIHSERHGAASMLASSVFNSDLALEQVERAAIKFLLGTGCRQNPVLLRGSYLLQTIRTFYHIYLTTDSQSNKTTARAALQQLVTSVFANAVSTANNNNNNRSNPTSNQNNNNNSHDDDDVGAPLDAKEHHAAEKGTTAADNTFPSENHRDAFLVLRSICKLSMRTLPDQETGMHSHIGLQTSASNDTWDGGKLRVGSERGDSASPSEESTRGSRHRPHDHAHLIYTHAIHPALESKLLALELILYVLQNIDFSTHFIQTCGSQFHAAVRNYLCVSLLKNCTSDNTRVVSLSLRIFVPVLRNFRTILKTEIEAFVTNVFFVILDSKNSPAEHKSIVVNTFNEICSDPNTLAEIFLNYDCDLSAVDLFHRIVNTLSRLSRTGLQEPQRTGMSSFMGGPSEAQMEKLRSESRELRLDAMRALRQILASLHASIIEPMKQEEVDNRPGTSEEETKSEESYTENNSNNDSSNTTPGKQNLVEIYGSKKKRRAEESEAVLRFNQKPSAGIAYAAKCKHIDAEDPADVARYLLKNKDVLEKTQIGEYLGREPEYQNGFSLKVLHEYVRLMDFTGLVFDDAIRFFLSGFRLPGEAQKIDRIMEKFAERFTEQNPEVFPSADVAFILSFSIIMLNTDLHNPAIKEERRMTKEGFVRNNRGICDGQDLPEEMLLAIFNRIKNNPISLKEDDEARERVGDVKKRSSTIIGLPSPLNPASFFSSHYKEMDRARETNFQKERDHIVRTTESLLKRRRHGHEQKSFVVRSRSGKATRHPSTRFVLSGDSGLKDEYVSPMFDVTWGPALAAFSTAIESANGSVGTLIMIASDEELELAAENAAETIEVCLTGFRFAIGTAGLCGNAVARDAYMLALSRFSQLGTGTLLEPRHIRCVQTMLSLAREDGELLGSSWEHVFKALSEINRFHQLFHLMARNDRKAAIAAERRRRRLEAKEARRHAREQRRLAAEDGESIGDAIEDDFSESDDDDSLAESGLFTDEEEAYLLEEDMDARAIDEANAREIYDAVSEATIEAIYERSSSLSAPAVKEFVVQLCLVSKAEISVGTYDHTDLTQVSYRQKHALLSSKATAGGDQFHHTQPNIYNLQKLVEVTHYNMASRPRLIFADLWIIVADHLTETALHSNAAIAMYAVDSFRQLCIQYLQRDELEVFEFQRRFLKPLETVMARSKQTSTKELLLNCVAQLIHVFGTGANKSSSSPRQGGLRSGWVPILAILGLGGIDESSGIARLSFKTLSDEIQLCLNDPNHLGFMLTEHFVETVNAILMFVTGPHEEISLLAIEQLLLLMNALAECKINPIQTKKKLSATLAENTEEETSKQKLDLWWPSLLGLSRAVGDSRIKVRTKSLSALFGIINKYFFAKEERIATFENLQLIFRGVLAQILEFADASSDYEPVPGFPDDFELLLHDSGVEKQTSDRSDAKGGSSWLETTFDSFMDECVAICLRSMKELQETTAIEEIFAILNTCLLADSGALVVRGLRRLEQFVTSDLNPSDLSEDVWATISHMLVKCVGARGLPIPPPRSSSGPSAEDNEREAEYADALNEFIAEDQYLPNRRYIGSNATSVIGLLLCSERFSISFKWRIFLIKGLSRGITEWDRAFDIVSSSRMPDYRETALYGRKWINRFVLQLASMKEVAQAPADADMKTNRFAAAQKLVAELTQSILDAFVKKEKLALDHKHKHTQADEILHKRYIALVKELLSGYGSMEDDYIKELGWICPVLLSSCIKSKNEDIRLMVQKLVSRISSTGPPAPYPSPGKPSEAKINPTISPESKLNGEQKPSPPDNEGKNGNSNSESIEKECPPGDAIEDQAI